MVQVGFEGVGKGGGEGGHARDPDLVENLPELNLLGGTGGARCLIVRLALIKRRKPISSSLLPPPLCLCFPIREDYVWPAPLMTEPRLSAPVVAWT